jgi:hypothetical protein
VKILQLHFLYNYYMPIKTIAEEIASFIIKFIIYDTIVIVILLNFLKSMVLKESDFLFLSYISLLLLYVFSPYHVTHVQ